MAFHRMSFHHVLRSSIFLEPFAPPELPGFNATMAPLTPTGLVVASGRPHRFMYRIVWPFRLQPPPVAPVVWLAFATGRTAGHGPLAGPPTEQGSARRHLGFALD